MELGSCFVTLSGAKVLKYQFIIEGDPSLRSG